jgi:hypothetical protein
MQGCQPDRPVAPTLLGLLNMDYISTFFGRNNARTVAQGARCWATISIWGCSTAASLAIPQPARKNITPP